MDTVPVLSGSTPIAQKRGFTLIEMLVVLAIIGVITSIVVTGQSGYNKTLLLTDTSYTVALSARQAQTFGIGSRKYGNVQNPGYGLHFNSALPGSYLMFADTERGLAPTIKCPIDTTLPANLQKPGNCWYDAADPVVDTYTFSRGFTVSKFCAKNGSGANVQLYCSNDPSPLTTLDMVFTRPNTTTSINGLLNGSIPLPFSCAEVTLTDQSKQATRSIRVSELGEISVNQTCP